MKLKLSLPKTLDWWLYLVPIILVAAGIVVIYSLTYYNNKIYLTYNQITYAIIGLTLMVAFTFIDYRNFRALAPYLYLAGLVLLVLVLFFGKSTFGATRWLDFEIFQLQPAEIFKFCLIILLARWLGDRFSEIRFRDLVITAILVLIPAFLIARQPDLGTTIILLILALAMVLASRLSSRQLAVLAIIVLIALPSSWFFLQDYQKQRIHTFLNPQADPFGSGYNVRQAIIAVGSGGLLGQGLGHGPQSQLNFLPIAHTDFIFAGLAEASGFVGSTLMVVLYLFLISRIVNVARISKDRFGMLLASGIAAMFLSQGFVNIGMNLGTMPVTGIPLPLVSFGGTALITNLLSLGILQSIYLRHKKISF